MMPDAILERGLRMLYFVIPTGLMSAISKYLSPIKAACPLVSWADLVQLAGAVAVEESGKL